MHLRNLLSKCIVQVLQADKTVSSAHFLSSPLSSYYFLLSLLPFLIASFSHYSLPATLPS
jgi:uncharacterized BrkB/YihY/UPF0761 family membrane protein